MKTTKQISTAIVIALGLSAFTGSWVSADTTDTASAPADSQLPPGWTAEDLQAMMEAATPGEMHKLLANDIGTWTCKTKMWMSPGAEPTENEGTSTAKLLLDGRYVQCDMKVEIPGMGAFDGIGTYGYDNATKQFVSTWIDNFTTGMMNGTGKLSADGKTLTWEFNGYCPIAKKQIVMREVDTTVDANTKKLEMFGPDPKTGKEFQTMEIVMTRK